MLKAVCHCKGARGTQIMGYSLDPISEGCYPGTTVLVNNFDIRNKAKLDEAETVLVSPATPSGSGSRRRIPLTFHIAAPSTIFYFLIYTIGRVKSVR